MLKLACPMYIFPGNFQVEQIDFEDSICIFCQGFLYFPLQFPKCITESELVMGSRNPKKGFRQKNYQEIHKFISTKYIKQFYFGHHSIYLELHKMPPKFWVTKTIINQNAFDLQITEVGKNVFLIIYQNVTFLEENLYLHLHIIVG